MDSPRFPGNLWWLTDWRCAGTRPLSWGALGVVISTIVTDRICTVLSGESVEELSADTVVVTLESEEVCGSGAHATTVLCLDAMMGHIPKAPPASLLDVGCGSGILAIVAAKLGVPEVMAIDVDPGSARVAAQAAAANGVAEQMTANDTDVADLSGTYAWVVANVETNTLVHLADTLLERVAPGGYLLLSGITTTQEARLDSAFPVNGAGAPFELVERNTRGAWISLLLHRR